MHDFKALIFLVYVRDFKDRFNIVEVMQLLGVTFQQAHTYIDNLLEKKLITNEKTLLTISQEGLKILDEENMSNFSFENTTETNELFSPAKALPIDQPYVPKKFATKVRTKFVTKYTC